MNYKVKTTRAKSSVSQDGAGKRIESLDGTRWAISRNQKRQLPDHRFDVVEVWTLKYRESGKVTIHSAGVDERSAKEWVMK